MDVVIRARFPQVRLHHRQTRDRVDPNQEGLSLRPVELSRYALNLRRPLCISQHKNSI
jgi:hypothetical protein